MGRVIAATVLIDRVIAGLNVLRLVRPLRKNTTLSMGPELISFKEDLLIGKPSGADRSIVALMPRG